MSTYLHNYWPTQDHVRNSMTQRSQFQIVMIQQLPKLRRSRLQSFRYNWNRISQKIQNSTILGPKKLWFHVLSQSYQNRLILQKEAFTYACSIDNSEGIIKSYSAFGHLNILLSKLIKSFDIWHNFIERMCGCKFGFCQLSTLRLGDSKHGTSPSQAQILPNFKCNSSCF